jgi:hypothetical protein
MMLWPILVIAAVVAWALAPAVLADVKLHRPKLTKPRAGLPLRVAYPVQHTLHAITPQDGAGFSRVLRS